MSDILNLFFNYTFVVVLLNHRLKCIKAADVKNHEHTL